MRYTFDETGSVIGFSTHYPNFTNGYWEDYLFAKNLQGDVVAMYLITVEPPRLIATYEYDEWGKVKTVRDATGAILTDPAHLANRNPFRYRSYHYDTETGFYYLQSRYYDPAISRFINADSYGSTGQAFLGTNMFAYCNNNPCNNIDATGASYEPIGAGIQLELSLDSGGVSVSGGVEVIVYWGTEQAEQAGEPIVAVYCYGAGSLDVDVFSNEIADITELLKDNLDLLKMDGQSALDGVLSAFKPGLGGSVSGLLVYGNESFKNARSYTKDFTTVSGTAWHFKGSYSYSDCCRTVGVGVSTSGFGLSFSHSYYFLLWEGTI
jgi:RHS repeat-associated protein